jgi:hypothetical protein
VKGFISTAAVIFFSGATMMAAEQTWVGESSDSACGAHHESGAENVPAPPAKECVENCLRGGSTYVLVGPEHKVFQIANQTAAGLKENAGGKVKVTGELKGDSITVSKVEKAE